MRILYSSFEEFFCNIKREVKEYFKQNHDKIGIAIIFKLSLNVTGCVLIQDPFVSFADISTFMKITSHPTFLIVMYKKAVAQDKPIT